MPKKLAEPGLVLGEQFVVAAGILTALVKTEMVPTESVLEAMGWNQHPTSGELTSVGIQGWSKTAQGHSRYAFTMAFAKMGQALAAIETMVFLTRCKPSLVVLTGIAGSLKPDSFGIGDVVVGTGIHWRQQDKVADGDPCDVYRPRPIPIRHVPDNDEVRKLEQWLATAFPEGRIPAGDNKVSAEEIFTWDYVVSSTKWVNKLTTDFPKAACVEMEAGGFLTGVERHAAAESNAPLKAYIVRGISDLAANKVKASGSRELASRNAATVAVSLIEHFLIESNKYLLMR